MTPKAELIALHEASYVLKHRKLIDGVNLSVKSDEITTIIGPNGAGKSTLLKLVLGLLPLSGGTRVVDPKLRVGYVPQQFRHADSVPMTVIRMMHLTHRPSHLEVAEALAETGIAHLAAAQVDTLSGGELQRALLARAILRKPNLLVLDEPVQAVDFLGEVKIYQLISAIRQKLRCGILMVSHDLHIVMAESDRVICLNGHICCEGQPQKVTHDPEFINLFGPDAARMIAAYQHHHDHEHDACDGQHGQHGHAHGLHR